MRIPALAFVVGTLLAACGDPPESASGKVEVTDENLADVQEPIETDEIPSDLNIEAATPSTSEGDTVRQAESHIHGDAKLAVVLEGSTLTIELDTPLYNLTGFEHAPDTNEQKAAVKTAEALLSNPSELFQLNAEAECTDISDIDGPHLIDDHESEDHNDSRHHDEDHHDEAHEDHDNEEAHTEEHKDVLLTYEFACENPSELTTLTTTLLSGFSNMTEIEVIFLGPNSQEFFELNASNSQINLR